MKNKKQLLGIVLCGGQSSRMGTDKALIKTHNQTWLDKSISLLLTLNIEVVLSVNSRQYPFYENTFSSIIIINDDKDIDVKGPLLGLLSVHKAYPDKDLFVLACDLPLMRKKVMEQLQNNYNNLPGKEAYVFNKEGEYEPLCAIYTSAGLAKVKALLERSLLKKFSMRYVLETIDTAAYPLPSAWKQYFINVNTQEDLHNLPFKR